MKDNANRLTFPALRRWSTLPETEAMLLVVIGAGTAPFIGFWSLVFAIPLVTHGAFAIAGFIHNRSVRKQWAQCFSARVPVVDIGQLVAAVPGRFVLHIRHYGGFDVNRQLPAAILENTSTGELIVVHPSSWRLRQIADSLQLPIIEEYK